jgi:hypothetical protein
VPIAVAVRPVRFTTHGDALVEDVTLSATGLASTGSPPIALISGVSAAAVALGTAAFLTFRRRARH